MMRSKPSPLTSMQKTFDDCHLLCSTAVYFENQSNEAEALRNWRDALDAIYYHNAYKMPSGWRAKTGIEKTLHESLQQLEIQCKERVDLLRSLRDSREQAKQDAANSLYSGDSSSINTTDAVVTPGWLGDGTIQPADYASIPKPAPISLPMLPPRKTAIKRPSFTQRLSGNNVKKETSRVTGRSSLSNAVQSSELGSSSLSPSLTADSESSRRSSRPTSPEKKTMLRTLRTSKDGRNSARSTSNLRSAPPMASAKAASQAWGTSVSGGVDMDDYGSTKNGCSSIASSSRRQSDDEQSTPMSRNGQISPILSRENIRKSLDEEGRYQRINGRTNEIDNIDGKQSYKPLSSINVTRSANSTRLQSESQNNISKSSSSSSSQQYSSSGREGNASNPSVAPNFTKANHSIARKAVASASASTSAPVSPYISPTNPIANDNSISSGPSPQELWVQKKNWVLEHLPPKIDPTAAQQILNEIVVTGDPVRWSDISGLDAAKSALRENVIYPFLRPDLFRGLREPARGILLFGPPGTGKTMLARAVATESRSTFFSIGAGSLTSKYLGESEKLVRALFTVAKMCGPSIVFVDEIESLLGKRGEGSHDALERVKTEFLVGWSDLQRAAQGSSTSSDGASAADNEQLAGDADRVLVLAATNLPWLIDEAARRRFVRRQYIPLPEDSVRKQQLSKLLEKQKHNLDDEDLEVLVQVTDGYSGSDITALAKDAAMGPLRALGERLLDTSPEDIRSISFEDFEASLVNIRPSVSKAGLKEFEEWAAEFGERGG